MSVYDENNQPANPEALVDRLVDGELGEADRRELLLQLEHEPDGWRRCALAFLEAQCWKAELGQMAPPPAPQAALAAPVSRAEPAGRWQSWRQYVATTLTMAASFLIALVLGMGLRGTWPGITLHSPGSSQVQSTIDKTPLPEAPTSLGPDSLAHAVPAVGASDGWEMVTLDPGKLWDGQTETFRVPARNCKVLDQDILKDIPDVIPPDLRQALEQSGNLVVQKREIVPVKLKDGRQLVVPVDRIEIHHVGRPSL